MGEADDSYRRQQEDELIAIRSILIDGIKDCRRKSNKHRQTEWSPLHLLITVKPQQSFAPDRPIHATVDLRVQCGPQYPKKRPNVTIENPKGLPASAVSRLLGEVQDLAKKHEGEEVIYTLLEHIREFLVPFNKPGQESFYHEMLQNRQEEEKKRAEHDELHLEKRRAQEEKDKKLLHEQLQMKQMVLKNEARIRRDSMRSMNTIEKEVNDDDLNSYLEDLSISYNDPRPSPPDDDMQVLPVHTSTPVKLVNDLFEICHPIGKGAFGSVYKVRHRIDQRFYALKKIALSGSQKIKNKISREVSLLSGLEHENIVRYFSTWIEEEVENESSGKMHSSPDDDDESDEDNSVEEEDEGLIFGSSFLVTKEDTSEFIVFEGDSRANGDGPSEITIKEELTKSSASPSPRLKRYMYIQMELCDKDTLRMVIDSGLLYKDNLRKRRFFREIVDGLAYLHEREIIHRDLKPGNIFLDSKGHAKIGDFGLACTELFTREVTDDLRALLAEGSNSDTLKYKGTGLVGTPLYIAPELVNQTADVKTQRILYSQKVDIYSLGIILFQMCYPPPETGSERIHILTNLRKKEIIFPNDKNFPSEEETKLIRQLLQHNVKERPSSKELLNHPYLPPPELEEKEKLNIIKHVVSNPSSKTHKFMLNQLMSRSGTLNEDILYDFDERHDERPIISEGSHMRMKKISNVIRDKRRIFQYVSKTIQQVAQRYSAFRFVVPAFMPSYSLRRYNSKDQFQMIDRNGTIIAPPYNLRVPFARHVARYNISSLRRYAVERVFRQRKANYHPIELWECAFDIVESSPTGQPLIVPDVEVLLFLKDVLNEFPSLIGKNLTLRINHMKLLKGLLLYCDFPDSNLDNMITIIADHYRMKTSLTEPYEYDSVDGMCMTSDRRQQFEERLITEGIRFEKNKLSALLTMLEIDRESVNDLRDALKNHLRKKTPRQVQAAEMVWEAVTEMRQIVSTFTTGIVNPFKMKFEPSLVVGSYKPTYSHFVFQLEREVISKGKTNEKSVVRLAVGGRYDDILESFKFRDIGEDNSDFPTQHTGAVGVSLEIERLIRQVMEEEKANNMNASVIDVAIFPMALNTGSNSQSQSLLKEMNTLARELRGNNLSVSCFAESSFKLVEDINYFCLQNAVKHCVILKEQRDSDGQIQIVFKISSNENDRLIEKRSGRSLSETIEHLRACFFPPSKADNSASLTDLCNTPSKCFTSQYSFEQSNGPSSIVACSNIFFLVGETKLQPSTRKRYTNQINNLLLAYFNNNVQVLALELPYKILKSIPGELDLCDDLADINKSIDAARTVLQEKHPRYRNYLSKVLDQIADIKSDSKGKTLIALVSYIDMKFIIIS